MTGSEPSLPSTGIEASDAVQRRAAKLFNERLKLGATFFNNVGVATFIATALAPSVSGGAQNPLSALFIGLVVMLVLHGLGQLTLSRWKSEE